MTTAESNVVGQPAEIAIPRLLEDVGDRIFGLGMKLCGDRQEAEDLVQETFLQAYRKWHQFEGRSQPSSWLYMIAARTCKRRHRRRSGEPRRMESLSALEPGTDAPVVELADMADGPFDEQLRREAKEAIDRGLAKIPLHFRLPLVLKDIAELSVEEVAEILGLKKATVKTRVHRARLALREELVKALPKRDGDSRRHEHQVCLDLLHAKQEAFDRGVEFPVSSVELCSRCRSFLATMDRTHEACRLLSEGPLPEKIRRRLMNEFERRQ